MERRKRTDITEQMQHKGSVTAILTGDWHLRDSVPSCRTDAFEGVMWRKVEYIADMQEKYHCPVLHSGDLFHNWKPSPYLLAKAIKYVPRNFCTIFGNHDLPQHNLELADKCGIYVLLTAGVVSVLTHGAQHWGTALPEEPFVLAGRKILVSHIMTYQGKTPYPGCTDTPAAGLLRKHKEYDLILTGHNHQQFVEMHDGRLLVNPGCITRQESDQVDFRPAVWLWYAESNTVEKHYLPISKGVVQKPENVERVEERNARIDAFISKLNSGWDESIDFEQNLERVINVNKVSKEIQDIIYNAIES